MTIVPNCFALKKLLAITAVGVAGLSFVLLSWPSASRTAPVSPDAEDLLEREYATKLVPKASYKAAVSCRSVTFRGRRVAWCGIGQGSGGPFVAKGYWEIERIGDEVHIYAMNGEALRALKDFAGSEFKSGFERPYLDINALDAAYAD